MQWEQYIKEDVNITNDFHMQWNNYVEWRESVGESESNIEKFE